MKPFGGDAVFPNVSAVRHVLTYVNGLTAPSTRVRLPDLDHLISEDSTDHYGATGAPLGVGRGIQITWRLPKRSLAPREPVGPGFLMVPGLFLVLSYNECLSGPDTWGMGLPSIHGGAR